MVAAQTIQPFALLREIEMRSQQKAFGLPQQVEVRRTWSGIGFRLDSTHLVIPNDEVTEIMRYPSLTQVPSAQVWVKGIANIRGSLLPIMDLNGFIEGKSTKMNQSTRVLVINQGGLSSGLIVDEVLGLRHFFTDDKTEQLPEGVTDGLKAYLTGYFREAEVNWGIFSMRKLAKSPRFLEVAARG